MQIQDTLNIFPKEKLNFIAVYKHFVIFCFLAISDLLVRFIDFLTVMQDGFNKYISVNIMKIHRDKEINLTAFLMDVKKVFEKSQLHSMAKTLKKIKN